MFIRKITDRYKEIFVAALIIGILVFLMLPASASHQSRISIDMGGEGTSSRSITLSLNKAAIVELPIPMSEIVVSQPEIASAKPLKSKRIYLLGEQVGQTNAFFFDANGNQFLNLEIVVERDLDALHSLLDRLLPSSRIRAEAVNDNIILKGSVDNMVDASTAKNVAQRFIGEDEKVLSLISIRERGQVMLKVRIAEMQRNLIKQIGINTEGFDRIRTSADRVATDNAFAISGQLLGGLSSSVSLGASGSLTDLNVQFEAFERVGLMKTLAEPNLTAVSGESATFLAGGEFPIPVARDQGDISIEFKPFGVALAFSPVVLSKGRIALKVKTEVSELNQANGFDLAGGVSVDSDTGATTRVQNINIPGLTVRRAETSVELPSGGSIAMAGLLQENIQSVIDGVPGAKDIPILGQLFKSTEYLRDETELVIIITPYLVEPTSEARLQDPSTNHIPPSNEEILLFNRLESRYELNTYPSSPHGVSGIDGFIVD